MRDHPDSRLDIFLTLIVVIIIVIADRVTKVLLASLLDIGETLPVIPNILHFTLVHNTGIAFGLFKDQGIVFIIIPLIAVGLLIFNIYYFRNNREKLSRVYLISFSLILGGAIGNLIDRIRFGHVIDFIDFQIWPVFNIADSAITIGAILILFQCIPRSAR